MKENVSLLWGQRHLLVWSAMALLFLFFAAMMPSSGLAKFCEVTIVHTNNVHGYLFGCPT